VGSAVVLVCAGAALIGGGAASAAPGRAATHGAGHPVSVARPVLGFDDTARTATLVVPTPVCPGGAAGCTWTLFMNEPQVPGSPTVGSVSGTSGVLTLPYPSFCGVVQIDALLGPAPLVRRGGRTHVVTGCMPPPSTTTTTTTTPPGPTPSTVPPQVAATSAVPPEGAGGVPGTDGTVLPFTDATTAPTSTSAQLPFTGLDVRRMLAAGTLLLAAGLWLLLAPRRQRVARRR
jgi:hypothetical protein